MTNMIIAIDGDTFIHRVCTKSPNEICREIELGVFESPFPLTEPIAIKLHNYVLIAEREKAPMISKNQLNIMEMLSLGASEKEIAAAMHLSFSTIRKHVDGLKKKFCVSTREELIAIYCRRYMK